MTYTICNNLFKNYYDNKYNFHAKKPLVGLNFIFCFFYFLLYTLH